MKYVKLTRPQTIMGEVHNPAAGPILVSDEQADFLVGAGHELDERLETKTVPQLTELAAERQVDLTGITKKADIIAALLAQPS